MGRPKLAPEDRKPRPTNIKYKMTDLVEYLRAKTKTTSEMEIAARLAVTPLHTLEALRKKMNSERWRPRRVTEMMAKRSNTAARTRRENARITAELAQGHIRL